MIPARKALRPVVADVPAGIEYDRANLCAAYRTDPLMKGVLPCCLLEPPARDEAKALEHLLDQRDAALYPPPIRLVGANSRLS